MITIELFGVARLRAGRSLVTIDCGVSTLAGALAALADTCPALDGPVVVRARGAVCEGYRVSLNADRFLDNPETPLSDGDALLLISADTGG
jgi:molybdopterin converting factor small subunit